MAAFCKLCGAQLKDNSRFCSGCGAPAGQAQPQPVRAAAPAYAGNGPVRQGIPAPGFSDRVDHPEIVAAMKRSRKAAAIFAVFIIPLPFAGFMIYSAVSDKMETKDAALYGGIVSAVFLLFSLISLIRSASQKSYDAVVIDKRTREVERTDNSGDDRFRSTYTEYITTVQTTQGRKKKIKEREGSMILAYNYLQAGDRFRYHPRFHFPYELYDKSKGPYIRCVSCMKDNPVAADRCSKCGIPLLK